MFFLDNVDPDRTASLLEALDPRKTVVNVITKSGDTAETLKDKVQMLEKEWYPKVVKALASSEDPHAL